MKNKLAKWFALWALIMIVGLTLFAVFGPQGKKIDLKEIGFDTSQSTELYFKNVRAYFYDREIDSASSFNIYRINSRNRDGVSDIQIGLLHNWRMSQCYVLLESEKYDLNGEEVFLVKSDSTISLSLPSNSELHYRFAATLFESLSAEQEFELRVGDKPLELSESQKTSLKQSLKDYFKLVGKIH